VCNIVTFDKYIMKLPSVISFYSMYLLIYLIGLQKDEANKDKLIEWSHKLKQAATNIFSHYRVDVDAR
jgi:hypothetical protein